MSVLSASVVALLMANDAARERALPSQESWQADVRVQSIVLSAANRGQIATTVTITSDNDDDARSARADILLPVGVGVLRMPANCAASPTAVSALNARVTCNLGDIPVRGLSQLFIITTAVPGNAHPRFAVFVMSDTPDPDPANNYAERNVP